MNIQEEGRLKFWRYEFQSGTGGTIDRYMCDQGDDPNKEEKPWYSLNTSATYYRLNGEGRWVSSREFNRGFFARIQARQDSETAADLWNESLEKWSVEVLFYHIQQQWNELQFKFDYGYWDGHDGYKIIVNDKPTRIIVTDKITSDLYLNTKEQNDELLKLLCDEIQSEIDNQI